MVKEKITMWVNTLSDVVFPPVCACCGQLTEQRADVICRHCLHYRFETDPETESLIMPESVLFRYSLWSFDKLGYLQDLLHKLKYDHLAGVGHRLGTETGKRMMQSPRIGLSDNDIQNSVLVPVPLHKKRYRKRGYNQSMIIANGISESTSIPVVPEETVVRVKNTTTQTGLNSDERIKNLSGAFRVKLPENLRGRSPIIVDDVYTTGSTTFELAGVLFELTGNRCGIITVART